MNKLVTLMYHSIYATAAEYEAIRDEDRPYAVHVDDFKRHLQWMSEEGFSIVNPMNPGEAIDRNRTSILITFDDGHVGFYRYAYPLLAEYDWSAIFFVTTDLVEERPEFCTWEQLREMSRNNMSLQSHGKTHEFLDDMPDNEIARELACSKKAIEENTASRVWSVSFPGGRYNRNTLRVAQENGYSGFFTSVPRCNRPEAFPDGLINRFAIKNSTTASDIAMFIDPGLVQGLKQSLFFAVKSGLRKVLGNHRYHALYKFVSKG